MLPAISIMPTTQAENLYTYTQSSQISGQTGCIGFLRCDVSDCGNSLYVPWFPIRGYLENDVFIAEREEIVAYLRTCILQSINELCQYCLDHPQASMDFDSHNYGFRINTDCYTYMIRLNPSVSDYNFHCYCYRRDWLDQHMHQAQRGIRFIDDKYNDLFRINDGDKIRIQYSDGSVKCETCRYIDEYHIEINSVIFHICEYAERMRHIGATIEPVFPIE